jgi:predicted DsbA family dithiol-disulfide isomerase
VRLGRIEAEYGDAVEVTWRSYLLRPEPERRDLDAFSAYTRKWAGPADIEPAATFRTWSGENPPPTHSYPSALAGKVAESFGREAQRAYASALFRAYFAENRTISDRDVLVEVAAGAGLDPDAFERRWREREDELGLAVWQDYLTAVQSKITGVPAVVVDRTWLVPGAVDEAEYRRAIAMAVEAAGG